MNLKDQQIEETLNSFKGVKQAEADPFLYEKVMNKLQLHHSASPVRLKNYGWQLAALFLLLIVNSYFVLRTDTTTETKTSGNNLATEYFNQNTYNY